MILLDSDEKIKQKIIKAIVSKIEKRFANARINILNKVRTQIRAAIISSPEYDSIMNGELKQHFGLINPSYALNNILQAFDAGVKVEYRKLTAVGGQINGGLSISIARPGFSNILEAPGTTYYSGEYEISWLKWLLEHGEEEIVQGWKIKIDPNGIETSRAGEAIMIEEAGASWGIPQYTGTPGDNWFTRALKGINLFIEIEMRNALRHA